MLKMRNGSCLGVRRRKKSRTLVLKSFSRCLAFIMEFRVLPMLTDLRPVTTLQWRDFGVPLSRDDIRVAQSADGCKIGASALKEVRRGSNEERKTSMDPTKDNTKSREEDNQPMRFANATLGQHRHVCAFFHDTEEEYRVLLPFVKEGLARGEKAFHIVDPKLRDEHLERLSSAGVDVPSVEKNGQFELHHWHEVYLRDGHFDRDRMLACMQDVLEQSQRDGFPLARVMGHAEWASGDWPGVDDFLEYECRLNDIIPQYKDAVICLYNLTKCGGNLIIDVMRTHPMILIGGIVQENPFFVPPIEFLRELRERRSPRTKATA